MNTGQFVKFNLLLCLGGQRLQELEPRLEVIAQAQIATAQPHKPQNL